jgi:hypothetical protein
MELVPVPVFHIGRAPTRRELLRSRRQQIQRKKKKQNKKVSGKIFNGKESDFKKPIFNILPEHLFHPRVYTALEFTYANPNAVFEFVERWVVPPFHTTPGTWKDGMNGFWSPELREAIEDAVFLVLQKRFLLRQFLHHWRFRRLQKGNTTDLLTDEVPKNPVSIVDWKINKVWTFEATSMMRDITTRLYNHDGFFEDPLSPRNPYTNQLLSANQTISLWNQLSYSGIPVSTPFTSFRAARWNLKRFSAEQSIPLQLFAFRKTMKDMSHYDTLERMLDFIQTAYNHEAVDCYNQAYSHALVKYPENPLVKRWQHLCLKFYEAEIAFYNNLDKKEQIQNKVWDETVKLLDKQKILVTLRNEDLRSSLRQRGDITFPPVVERFVVQAQIIPAHLLTQIVETLEFSFNL